MSNNETWHNAVRLGPDGKTKKVWSKAQFNHERFLREAANEDTYPIEPSEQRSRAG